MTLFKLNIRSAIGDTGDFVTRDEVYTVEPNKDGTISLWQMHESRNPKDAPGTLHRGSMGWSGYASVIEFAAERQKDADKWAAEALKQRHEAAAAARRAEIAQPAVDAILAAFDLTDRSWEWKLWGEVGEQAGANLLDHLGEAMLLPPSRRGPTIRKLMRSALTEAKTSLREEYPEDYREAEDKEDFYLDYLSDMVEAISLEVQA